MTIRGVGFATGNVVDAPDVSNSGVVYTATVNTLDNLNFRTDFNNASQYQAFFDFDGDGQINTTDNLQFRARFNTPLTWSL